MEYVNVRALVDLPFARRGETVVRERTRAIERMAEKGVVALVGDSVPAFVPGDGQDALFDVESDGGSEVPDTVEEPSEEPL